METRVFQIGEIRADTMTADATLSTEFPVRRYDGEEVLSHDPSAVDLSRAPLPLIVGHDGGKLPVGVVESLRIEGKSLKGVLRFSKSATDIWEDVKDGILRNLSIGYQILERAKTKTGYVASKWMPYECSLVAAGADPAAGIGRELIKTLGGNKTMDKNDLLKERKICTDKMIELAGRAELSSEDKESFDRHKDAVEKYDERLAMLEDVDKYRKDEFKRVPAMDKKESREILPGVPVSDRSYRGMFGEPHRDEEEIRTFRTQLSGLPSGGGFAVPEPLAAAWMTDAMPEELIRPRASVYPMTSQSLSIPGWDWSDMSAGKCFGGFEIEWLAEEGTGTPQTGKLRKLEMSARKGALLCDCSQELADDGVNFTAQLEKALKKSLAYGLEEAFTNGAVGPLGVTNDAARIEISPETGQSGSINFENVTKLYSRMYAGGRRNCVFLASDTLMAPMLTSLNVAIGTAGSWVNVFNEKNGEFTVLGRPVLFTPHLPIALAANSIMCLDLSQFAIGMRKDLRLERSNIPQWTKDLLSFRLYIRVDSMGTWNAPYTPDNGDTQSWCVGLGAI